MGWDGAKSGELKLSKKMNNLSGQKRALWNKAQLCVAKCFSRATSKPLQTFISIGWKKTLNATQNLFIFKLLSLKFTGVFINYVVDKLSCNSFV